MFNLPRLSTVSSELAQVAACGNFDDGLHVLLILNVKVVERHLIYIRRRESLQVVAFESARVLLNR